MKVSVQYAESHLTEFLPATGSEEAATGGNGAPAQGATAAHAAKRGLWGAGEGEIWMADDWDSPETNREIADLFNGGPVVPGDSGA
jgi:hypothetical protein